MTPVNHKTIIAQASAQGKAGVAVIRISGPDALKSLKYLCPALIPHPRYAHTTLLLNPTNQEIIDQALILFFKGPSSFTGEDVVEIHTHGNSLIVKKIITLLISSGLCVHAKPGEFSKRAVLNGKIDLTQAEGILDLIHAETDSQHKLAISQVSGVTCKTIEKWKDTLLNTLTLIAATIDFPDEDIPTTILQTILNNIQNLINDIGYHLHDNNVGELIRSGITIPIIGPPNVGKSSLLNTLTKRDVAIVSDTAGTTRDSIEVSLDVNGVSIILIDTAGIQETHDVIEQEGIKRSLAKAKDATFKMFLFDSMHLHDQVSKFYDMIDENSFVVINKIDLKPISSDLHINLDNQLIPISLKDNEGIDQLIALLESKVMKAVECLNHPLITRERHRVHIQAAHTHLTQSLNSLSNDYVLFAEDCRLAAIELSLLIGNIGAEDILDNVFSNFCIGK